jgi:tetratricopeptide (TPR) repeat protein
MPDDQRIDELRRRVQKDPASIAFAALAEEHRRLGELDEAVRLCREGLEHHPTYVSARVTLGRALLDMNEYADSRIQLEHVLGVAPDNLLALKCMAQLRERTGEPEPPAAVPDAASVRPAAPAKAVAAADPSLAELEGWLGHIVNARDKGAGTPT